MCRTFVLTALVVVGITSSVAVAQDAQFAYVGSVNSGNLVGYKINPVTGDLAPLPGSPFASGGLGTAGLAVAPGSRFLYVLDDNIAGFRIDPVSGRLTQLPGSTFAPEIEANSIAIDPTGNYLYATATAVNTIFAFRINPTTGKLTTLPGSPFPTGGNNPSSVTVDPLGNFLYVTNEWSDDASGFTINPATGGLTPIPGSPFPIGVGPVSFSFDPLDRFAYVGGASTTYAFSIAPTTGALVPLMPKFFSNGNPETQTVDPRGKFVYTAAGMGVYGYTIGQVNLGPNNEAGDVTLIAGSPFGTTVDPSLLFPVSVVVDYTGSFVYATYYFGGIIGYKINPGSGALTPVGSAFATSGARSIIALARPQTTPVYTAKQIPEPAFGPFASFTGSAINNKGEVTGQAVYYDEFLAETFLYNGSTTNGASPRGTDVSGGNAINNNAEIVGYSIAPSAAPEVSLPQSFLYRSATGATFALDPRVGGESTAQGINDAEHITGSISARGRYLLGADVRLCTHS
jgi:6-phosphogluconolactonase